MSELLSAATGAIAGVLLGIIFFGGLWWTIRRALSSQAAGVWFACSYLLRFALLAAGLYVLAHDDAIRGLGAAFGLIAARFGLVRLGLRGISGPSIAGKPR
jgi:F1F0 ATPase subunit 2